MTQKQTLEAQIVAELGPTTASSMFDRTVHLHPSDWQAIRASHGAPTEECLNLTREALDRIAAKHGATRAPDDGQVGLLCGSAIYLDQELKPGTYRIQRREP